MNIAALALIEEDLRLHPNSKISEIAQRLPDLDIKEIRRFVYAMIKESKLVSNGAKRNKTYCLPNDGKKK